MSIIWDEFIPSPNAGAALKIIASIIDDAGAAVDGTGQSFAFWMTNEKDSNEVYDFTNRLTTISVNPLQLQLFLLRSDTLNFDGKTFKAEFWRVDGNNDYVLAEGYIVFDPVARSKTDA